MLIPQVFLLVACSEQEFISQLTEPEPAAPEIDVSPGTLNFGESRSDGEVTRGVEVENLGDAPLSVDDLVIEGGSFTLLYPEPTFRIAPGDSVEVPIAFTPAGPFEQVGVLTVLSDDDDEPEVLVELIGEGATPYLTVGPAGFGDVEVGCDEEADFWLENTGTEPLVIDSVAYATDGQMKLLDENSWPITLDRGETALLGVRFRPFIEGPAEGTLTVVSNDPRGDQTSTHSGNGVLPAEVTDVFSGPSQVSDDFVVPDRGGDAWTVATEHADDFVVATSYSDTWNVAAQYTDTFTAPTQHEDNFVIPYDPPVDILFAVDQSCSMDTVTVPLGQAFASFIAEIGNVTDDWNIGVVTNDNGCFNSGVITESTYNYSSVFANAVDSGGCAWGAPYCDTESLSILVDLALDQTGSTGCNKNFLRAGSPLHIIFVSDEAEQSGTSWSTWLSRFDDHVDPSLLKVSVIGDLYEVCGEEPAGAWGYQEMAWQTGGETLDVCNNGWAAYTEDLALASLTQLHTYELGAWPEPSTLVVKVDGVQWYSGWHYDSGLNAIVFDVEMNGGEFVEIEFLEQGAVTDYPLSTAPNTSTLQVTVDGVVWSSGWSYDPYSGEIVFSAALPDGAQIVATYYDAWAVLSYGLLAVPEPSTLTVSVDGWTWTSGWSYDATANAITFSSPLTAGQQVTASYLGLGAVTTYVLSATPNPTTLVLYVNGVLTSWGWHYDSTTNEIVLDTYVAGGSTLSAHYYDATATLDYTLSQLPDASSIEVYVDGVLVKTWHYDAATNAIVFDVAPPEGATVTTEYLLAAATAGYALTGNPDPSTISVFVDGYAWSSYWGYDAGSNSILFDIELSGGSTVTVTYVELGQPTSFGLSGVADPATVEVLVNGAAWSDWHFVVATQTVVFDALPPAGATVEVTYRGPGSCS